MTSLGLAKGASMDRLAYAPSLAEAVANAEFIQESAPEDVQVKIKVVAELDAAASADVVISSSTSGFSMSDLQVECAHPERTVVGHPFHPVYLLPLVEVVAGERSDPGVADWTKRFYDHAGKSAVICKDRVYGFLANRLQSAIWREALHMLARGEATVDDLDRCITEGPGLRWAFTGPFLTNHLAAGEGDMREYIDKFGALEGEPYSLLASPQLTPDLKRRMIEGCERLSGDRPVSELVEKRDCCLVEIQKVLSTHWKS